MPIRERDLLEPNKIDIIFQHVQRVLQCHAMFNIALSARMADWTPNDMIGDILYALVSYIIVYSETVIFEKVIGLQDCKIKFGICLTLWLLKLGHWEEDYPITAFFEKKKFSSLFANAPINLKGRKLNTKLSHLCPWLLTGHIILLTC